MTEAVIYTNQSIDLQSKSMNWFLHDNGLRHERVNQIFFYMFAYPISSNFFQSFLSNVLSHVFKYSFLHY